MKKYLKVFKININDENYDEDDMHEDLAILKDMLKIRDINMIFNHEILVEKEMILLLGADLPEPMPFFQKISWNVLKEFEDQINECKKFNYETLGLDKSTINEINSLFSSFFDNIHENKEKINDIEDSKRKLEEISKENSNKFESLSLGKKKYNSANTKKNEYNENFLESNINEIKVKNRSASVNINIKDKSFPESFIKTDDLRINENIENINFNYFIPDNNIVGTLFEGDVINYVYDIFNLLTLGNLSFYRNIKYEDKFELDFQLSNIKLKDFLYFVALFLPNIPTLQTLKIKNITNLFEDKINIFQDINNYILNEDNLEYNYVDILGEVTLDLLNIENKKYIQLSNYIKLIDK